MKITFTSKFNKLQDSEIKEYENEIIYDYLYELIIDKKNKEVRILGADDKSYLILQFLIDNKFILKTITNNHKLLMRKDYDMIEEYNILIHKNEGTIRFPDGSTKDFFHDKYKEINLRDLVIDKLKYLYYNNMIKIVQ